MDSHSRTKCGLHLRRSNLRSPSLTTALILLGSRPKFNNPHNNLLHSFINQGVTSKCSHCNTQASKAWDKVILLQDEVFTNPTKARNSSLCSPVLLGHRLGHKDGRGNQAQALQETGAGQGSNNDLNDLGIFGERHLTIMEL